jgi:hypothetical protein
MEEEVVHVPVTCPECGAEHFAEVPAFVLEVALNRWNNLRLHGRCHAVSWDASQAEMQKIRRYLGAQPWVQQRA